MKRSCGTLMHISSLPSPYGVGTLGKAAFAFADFLVASGQSYWQMLPLGPTGYGDSPYQCASTFAGNPYFIDLDLLIEDGLLLPEEVETVDWGDDETHVDFGRIFCARHEVLRRAFARGFERDAAAVAAFREAQAGWVEGYALFSAVKEHFGLRPFNEWDDDIRLHTDAAVARYRQLLHDEIDYHVYIQYLFYRQWNALRAYLSENQIRVIGDLPIYVPYDSADVWEHPSLFQLDDDRRPLGVAGVPPDYFSADGQLWGNPLYDWDAMADEGYRWWIERLGRGGRFQSRPPVRRGTARPFSRPRKLLGRSLRGNDRPHRHVASGAGDGARQRHPRGAAGAIHHRGGSRIPDAGGAPAAVRFRLPGHADHAVRL